MINTSAAYKAAVTADSRRVFLRAVVNIQDPDLEYTGTSTSGEAPVSRVAQITNRIYATDSRYATGEDKRWILDGTFRIAQDDYSLSGEIGFVGNQLSGADGSFSTPQYCELQFSGVDILQACSVVFPDNEFDGVAEDFTVDILSSGVSYHTETFTGNTDSKIDITGFTVNMPTAIRVTVTKWSKPSRYMRLSEILPGVFEVWDGDMLASFDMTNQSSFSGIALPYGTVSLTVDNLDRRFEPRNKAGIFQSLEERQGIEFYIGVRLADNTVEYVPCGVFYQYADGWKTSDNDITITWNLVDIVGLISSVRYIAPSPLPSTLGGWVASIVAQLGSAFNSRYYVDPAYSSVSLTVRSADDVADITCGDLLRYACMATGTFFRADAETGKLTVEPMWSNGGEMTLDNLQNYPVMQANPGAMALVFTINDGSNTQYVVSGDSTASGRTESINNPFIKTTAAAISAARHILSAFGGNQIDTTGRGDPSGEIGDVVTVELDGSQATTGRMMFRTLSFSDGVLKSCKATLLQADGGYLYETSEVITASGTWTAPAGVTSLRLILVGGGDGGTAGTSGDWDNNGQPGTPGLGGKVFAQTLSINPGQTFAITIGNGGAFGGGAGGDTTFGTLSSANGARFSPSYTELASGNAYALTGISNSPANTGNGGAAGEAGWKRQWHTEKSTDAQGRPIEIIVVDAEATAGTPGEAGASGVVIIYYDKGE